MQYLENDIKKQEWYQNLVDDCQTIIVERGYRARMEIIEGYHELEERIETDVEFKKWSNKRGGAIRQLADDIKVSNATVYFAIQFYIKWPELSNAFESFEEGKNISWFKIVKKYLLKPKGRPTQDQWLKVYDIWNFAGINHNFGIRYPRNIPAGIVLNVLYYYTRKNDLIVDPMAGGGVTIDCCEYYDRRCLAYDIQPKREDIMKNDILLGYPNEANNCDLIFLSPPYYKKKEKEYGEASISAKEKKDYLQDFDIIAKRSYEIIKDGGYLAFLMEPFIHYQDSPQSIWLYNYIERFLASNWSIERIYDVPQTSQRHEAWQITRAKKEKIALTLRRELIIFKKVS